MSILPHSGWASRAAELEGGAPEFRAKVRFYATGNGCRNTPIPSGISFSCKYLVDSREANDACLLFDKGWVEPGETVEAKFFFLLGEEAAAKFRAAGTFYLWEAVIIAEAIVLSLDY